MIMHNLFFLALASILLSFGWPDDDPKRDSTDKEGRAKVLSAIQIPTARLRGYQNWTMLTDGPVDVSEGLFWACAIQDPKAWEKLYDAQGPHWSSAVRVYANPIAQKAIQANAMPFPKGSVLVKEKLMDNKIFAITAMIREPDGYDRTDARNNWRYFYADKFEEMQMGRIDSCRKCHEKARQTDFAFLKYTDRPGYSSQW